MIDKISAKPNNYNTQKYWYASNTNFTHSQNRENNLSTKQKAAIFASAVAGMTPVLGFFAHKKGFSLNPLKIIHTPVKNWALFKYKPVDKTIEFEWKEITATATGSVVGGFVGGSLVDDKKNLRAKKREVLNQLLGDVIVPIGCVAAGAKIYNKFAKTLSNAMPQINSTQKLAKIFNAMSKNFPSAVATVGSLAIGIIAGNRVSNEINEKLYHKEVERGIKATDFAPHVDDLCMAVSMMNHGSTFASKIARVIPLALIVPGYETGTAQENS